MNSVRFRNKFPEANDFNTSVWFKLQFQHSSSQHSRMRNPFSVLTLGLSPRDKHSVRNAFINPPSHGIIFISSLAQPNGQVPPSWNTMSMVTIWRLRQDFIVWRHSRLYSENMMLPLKSYSKTGRQKIPSLPNTQDILLFQIHENVFGSINPLSLSPCL